MRNLATFVLGGGRGTRLYPLTKYRSKPAVPLAGKYRLIDIPISNCINSGLNRIYVLTQFMSVSLHRHIRNTYRFDAFGAGFVEILAAQQTMDKGTDWYQGTADAVRKNLRYLEQPGIDYVLILSGDQLYRMDYRDMLRTHRESGADATIAALPVDRQAASSLGMMRVEADGRVAGFVEKPKTDEALAPVLMDPNWFESRGVESRSREGLASMGIYLFDRDLLVEVLRRTEHEDFGRQIFPLLLEEHRVQVHLFDDYWEDIGTIRAFYEANLQLASRNPPFQLVSAEAPIYSRARFLPPSQFDGAMIRNSLIADGCQIGANTTIENSVIGLRCNIGEGVTIRDTVVMGADAFESSKELEANRQQGRPPIGIGAGSYIIGSILDKNCRIGQNVHIANTRGVTEREEEGGRAIYDGIPIVEKDAIIPDGWKLEE